MNLLAALAKQPPREVSEGEICGVTAILLEHGSDVWQRFPIHKAEAAPEVHTEVHIPPTTETGYHISIEGIGTAHRLVTESDTPMATWALWSFADLALRRLFTKDGASGSQLLMYDGVYRRADWPERDAKLYLDPEPYTRTPRGPCRVMIQETVLSSRWGTFELEQVRQLTERITPFFLRQRGSRSLTYSMNCPPRTSEQIGLSFSPFSPCSGQSNASPGSTW